MNPEKNALTLDELEAADKDVEESMTKNKKMQDLLYQRKRHVINKYIRDLTKKIRDERKNLKLEKEEARVRPTQLQFSSREELEQFLQEIKGHPTLLYNETRRQFSIKKKYQISNKAELKKFIYSSTNGLAEDEDLYDCYGSIYKDLSELKENNELIVMYNKDIKKNVLFPRDLNQPCARFVKDREPHFLKFLREGWSKIEKLDHNGRVGYLKERGIEPVLGFRPASRVFDGENEPQKRNKRSNFKFVNKWVSRQYQPDYKSK